MKSKIVCIGDELLIGQTINTNAAWMGETLFEHGIKVKESICISDTKEAIIGTLSSVESDIDLVLITGGLGPTVDDITKQVLCDFFETELVRNEEVLKRIEAFFAQRNRGMLESNKRQADLPKSAIILENKIGTASGMWFEKNGVIYVSMPGVPSEMKKLVSEQVIPRLLDRGALPNQVYKTVLTQGIGESFLVDKIEDWQSRVLQEGFKLAYLPSAGQVRIRIGAEGKSKIELSSLIEQKVEELKKLIPEYIFGYDKQTMQEVVGDLLIQNKATIVTAESCTGGYLAHLITSTPGASKYYLGSIISYDNAIKSKLLSVDAVIIKEHGAVSEPVVIQMANAVKAQMGADYAISFSGIAGPDGGTEQKPVGMIWLALATPTQTFTKLLQLGTNRKKNIAMASLTALNLLRLELIKALNLQTK
jgi:nicotinamide-nucleotide amidase